VSGLLAELKRRNVIRMARLYLVGTWLIVQVVETVLPIFDVPNWVLRASVVALAFGFVPATAFAWAFEWTPTGFRFRRAHRFDRASSGPSHEDRACPVRYGARSQARH
jgi:hypothetical protein